jgi:hypothetical protein
LRSAYWRSVFTISGPTETSPAPTATSFALTPTATLGLIPTTSVPGLISFPSYQFPTQAVIAIAVSLGIFLTVLVVAAALVASYKMRLNFRKFEITRSREQLAPTGLDEPAGIDNLTDDVGLDNLGAHQPLNPVDQPS